MKERPILFQGAMVRALLAGTKTQTRRAVKGVGQWPVHATHVVPAKDTWLAVTPDRCTWSPAVRCPYGQPGDRLWVKETFRLTSDFDRDSPARVAERCLDAGYSTPWAPIQYEADSARRNWQHVGTPPQDGPPKAGKTRVSIHMPRWACRLVLEVTAVRVERLQDISEADAQAEGVTLHYDNPNRVDRRNPQYREGYRTLWESINGAGSWDANPWVWVVSFRRLPA